MPQEAHLFPPMFSPDNKLIHTILYYSQENFFQMIYYNFTKYNGFQLYIT